VGNEEKTPEKEAGLFDPSSASSCGDLSASLDALEAEEGWDHVGQGRCSTRATPPELSRLRRS
jgi:hypothetical protein